MKRFFFFIVILSFLVIAEYFFFTEMFTQKRWPVLSGSLLIIAACIFGLVRFSRRSFISS